MFGRSIFLAGLALLSVAASAQTYWVHSATVTHSGGWPSVHVNTGGMFLTNGYTWDVTATGGQWSPGGLQADGTHAKVDAYYDLSGNGVIYGSATMSPQSYQMHRSNISITFKVRCSYTSTPPTPGTPTFAIRCLTDAEVDPATSPFYDHAIATSYYIAPGGTTVLDWTGEAEMPGGLEIDELGFVAHRSETGTSSGSWTSVGTNLWETTVTMPVPQVADYPDQDLAVYGAASANQSGSMLNDWTYTYTKYEYRCVSMGGITLQAGF